MWFSKKKAPSPAAAEVASLLVESPDEWLEYHNQFRGGLIHKSGVVAVWGIHTPPYATFNGVSTTSGRVDADALRSAIGRRYEIISTRAATDQTAAIRRSKWSVHGRV